MKADTLRPRSSASIDAHTPGTCFTAALFLACCLCLFTPATSAAAGAYLPACPDGRLLLIPGPEASQIARIFESLAPVLQTLDGRQAGLRYRSGRGGAYALRDISLEQTDGCVMAGVIAPSFLYQLEAPEAMVERREISVCTFVAQSPNALWVAAESPVRTLNDLLVIAREAANKPDSPPLIAGVGSYTDQHMATLQLNRAAGLNAGYSPALGSVQAADAVRTGKALACWGYALPRGGMPGMRALAVAAEQRSPALPDTPTFKESGVNFLNSALFGFAVSSAVPESRRNALREALFRRDALAAASAGLPGSESRRVPPDGLDVFVDLLYDRAMDDLEAYPMLPPGFSPRGGR